jgi:hypothetical protein
VFLFNWDINYGLPAGTQYCTLVLSYPLVMGATAHLFLPVYDTLQLTTSYEYLEIRHTPTSSRPLELDVLA